MGDSSGAYLFGKIFERLAKDPVDARTKSLAKFFWTEARDHDFCDYEMECDKSLEKLGLARKEQDPDSDDPKDKKYFYRRNGSWEE